MAGEVPDTAQMLRADADIDLALDKAGAAINAVARLANGGRQKGLGRRTLPLKLPTWI